MASEDEASASEAAAPAPGTPVVTVLGGIGNSLGGYGLQAEYYLGGGRFSVFGGMGYYSGGDDDNYPSGLAGAGGARVYAGGVRHRGFLELAVAPLGGTYVTYDDELVDQAMIYGPSAQVGYQLVKDSGFTFMASAGIGYGRWSEYDLSLTTFQMGLAIGNTWR